MNRQRQQPGNVAALSAVGIYPAIGPEFTAARNELSRWISAHSDLTPTKFFDPTATSSSGAGTLQNPYYTRAQINAAITGDMSNQILGAKRGTTTNFELVINGVYSSSSARPFIIAPYGNSGELPIFDAGFVVNSWALYSGSSKIYSYAQGATPCQVWQKVSSELELRFEWLTFSSGTLAQKIAVLEAIGVGYCFWDNNIFYCTPYDTGAVNSSSMYASSANGGGSGGNALSITYSNVAATGNIIVTGLAARHTRDSAIQISSAAGSNVTSVGQISVVGCDARNCGTPFHSGLANVGGSDAIVIYGVPSNGSSQSVLAPIQIRGNYSEDTGNNAHEVGFVDTGVIEFNVSKDSYGNGHAELYATCRNITTRFNKARFDQRNSKPAYTNGAAALGTQRYFGTLFWQAGYDRTNYAAATTPTNATAANTYGNKYLYNAGLDAGGDGAFKDDGCQGLEVRNNTFKFFNQNNYAVSGQAFTGFILNIHALTGAGLNAPVVDSNIFYINAPQYSPNNRMINASGGGASGYSIKGGNNIYYSVQNNKTQWLLNGTAYGAATADGVGDLATWVAANAATGFDVGSRVINPLLDANGEPHPFSPAIRCGHTAGFFSEFEDQPKHDQAPIPQKRKVQQRIPVTGETVAVGGDTYLLEVLPAGTLAALTIPFPALAKVDDEFCITTSQTLTALALSPAATGFTNGSTLGAGGFLKFIQTASGAWLRNG